MFLFRCLAFMFVAIFAQWLSTNAASARQETNPGKESTWQGTLDVGPAKLRLQFQLVRQEDGKYSGKLISVDQGNAVVELDSVEIVDRSVKLLCDELQVEYSGTFDESFSKVSGTFIQGAEYPLELSRMELPKDLKHTQTWKGVFNAGPREFDMQIRIFKDEKSKLHGKLDSFSEKLGDLSIDIKDGDEQSFAFDMPITKAVYEGKFNASRDRIEGKWKQSGQEFELNFDKVALAETRSMTPPKRPQNPTKPYPYRELEVTFTNAADKATLSGTLTMPTKKGKYAAAILISGSGGQDRDESLLEHKPFLVLADHLTRAGFAVLRYDDRGIAKSTGDHITADSRDFARDTAAAVDFLKQQAEIDPTKIGLIGHSEGGLIAPIVAKSRDDVAFVVMLAGPGVTGREIILNQTALIEAAEGASDEVRAVNHEFLMAALEQMSSAKTNDEIKTTLRAKFAELREKLSEAHREEMSPTIFESSVTPMLSPWFRYFLSYDPRPALSKLRCPVLALNGELDLQVDPKLNLPEIRKAFAASGNADVQVVELSGLNHLFQTAKSGSPSEYRTIDETMAPAALKAISEWLSKRFH